MKHLSIVAIPGSLRPDSSSHKVLDSMRSLVPHEVWWSVYDGVGRLPHFDDSQPSYPEVDVFREVLRNADAIIICTPEYAFGVPGSLKNALDWTVSSGEFVGKPVALVTASSQGTYGHAAMKLILTAINAKLTDDRMLLIPFIRSKFDSDGVLKDEQVRGDLLRVVGNLLQSAREPK
jgi:chromate reductase, NAD(P)H dehydrogenase (quinone)